MNSLFTDSVLSLFSSVSDIPLNHLPRYHQLTLFVQNIAQSGDEESLAMEMKRTSKRSRTRNRNVEMKNALN